MTTNDGEDKSSPTTQLSLRGAFVLVFLAGFATFHFLGPLRHFVLYPPGVSWHEEGHLGAWHMMLRSKHGDVMIDFLEDGAAPPPPPPPMAAASHRKHKHVHAPAHRVFISEDRFLNTRQRRKLITKPHTVLLYVQHMSRIYREAGRNLTGAYARSCYCLFMHGRRQKCLWRRQTCSIGRIGTSTCGRSANALAFWWGLVGGAS